jgi:hypothetical protein
LLRRRLRLLRRRLRLLRRRLRLLRRRRSVLAYGVFCRCCRSRDSITIIALFRTFILNSWLLTACYLNLTIANLNSWLLTACYLNLTIANLNSWLLTECSAIK